MSKILTIFGMIMFMSLAAIFTLVGMRIPFTKVERAMYFVFMFLFFVGTVPLFAEYIVDKEDK